MSAPPAPQPRPATRHESAPHAPATATSTWPSSWCSAAISPGTPTRTLLAERWPDVVNLADIRTVDWNIVEPVDVLTAGFPCQDISNAGKRAGITGAYSGPWSALVDAVRALHPPILFVENVAAAR